MDGALGFPKAVEIQPKILEKIAEYRKNGDRVIFTLDTHSENYLDTAEGKKLPIVHCIKSTEGHELYGEVAAAVLPDDIVIEKPAFGSPVLGDYLRRLNPDEVELCGLVTDICVVSNAIIAKAFLPECKITVDSAACASADINAHNAALAVMKSVQIEVI